MDEVNVLANERTKANLFWGIIKRLGVPLAGGTVVIFLKISPFGFLVCPEPQFTPQCVQASYYLFALLSTLGIAGIQAIYSLFFRGVATTIEVYMQEK